MGPREILIARHGQTDWNKNMKWQGLSDIPLNETGLSQARNLGESLKEERIVSIYSSDLKRAHKTAQIVAGILGVEDVKTDPRLRERFLGKFEGWHTADVGKYAGIPLEKQLLLETDEKFADTLETVEPWDIFRLRIWETFLDIAERMENRKTLIVVHGGVMRALYLSLNPDYQGFPNFKNCEFIRLTNPNGTWRSGH